MNNNINAYTIAFYNIENLFDIKKDPTTNDQDFLPTSQKRWTLKRYNNKLMKLGTVIPKIGNEDNEIAPVIIGLAEIENKKALSDLINSSHLKDENYSYIHYDSPDERGIDVALLYKSDIFKVYHSETFSVYLERENGEQDYTRDILLVKGELNNEHIHVIVNHWSSRREGIKETEFKRLEAANVVNTIIKSLRQDDPDAKIIVMGDFNDNPNSRSIQLLEDESFLFNPFKTVWSYDNGSSSHNFQWQLFDQILFSTNFFDTSNSKLTFSDAKVFNSKFLTQSDGKYKGQPFRTFVGKKYKGGYSDHFPVFIELRPS
ncbi:endonuclease/exonuclease/phosphatase family protein [Winogradskyella psychrotolerans]|uniref:endonuclease/exonuclease/phosphatase family protein n=1 Tax=Winogradskyella psychrotolerans TaxID=1344585 RepID=UPI001C07DA76|nr:endonuclease/exonuclease/phosphatase family protein [Winogradskyella psychrotolerans]MBU2929451.1 endonuclease/exonuclease/phosphatase family protein [Winogradskyella psychrotolerans]